MLHLHRSDRADGLIDALRALLAPTPQDPFAPEVVSVPTRGMERWIAQQLSAGLGAGPGRTDGVCANVHFPAPRRLVGDAVAAAAGVDPDEDPWLPERSVWPLLAVVDDCLGQPWLHLLAKHLGRDGDERDGLRRARRFSTVRRLADLFDGYALHRPDVVRAWLARDAERDGAGHADHWQAELLRRLRARIDRPGPAERLQEACERLRREPEVVDLPDRVSLFGLTRLPAGYRDILRALAAEREVHLFLLHPSAALWREIAAALRGGPPVVRRAEDRTATLPGNRLLASWGRDAREMQVVLLAAGEGQISDREHRVDHAGATLLARVQADVRADRRPPGPPLAGERDERPLLAGDDRSLQVHACHGRARQVEVLRDALLHLLDEDATLEPRDVIVMCPDIETFAPLTPGAFAAAAPPEDDDDDEPRPPDLRVRLADRSLRQTNPVLAVVARLLELADDRVTASQVLDLAGREPVRLRFGLDDDELARLEDWVGESGIRWGLDPPPRRPFGLQDVSHGTWDFGLDRVLVGVTMTEDERRLVRGVLPLDDVDSAAIDLAGRFAELVDRLGRTPDDLRGAKPVGDWAAAIARGADLLTDTYERDAWQRAELQRLLDDVVVQARGAADGARAELALSEVRALLADRLRGRPTRANFRTGHLTVCTLVPMRSVPHRVVCLLGLDDALFPRRTARDGDDLLLDDPHLGERDARSEDRQLLLDAVMAARERLLITYTGNDERTNALRPPAVPVGELLDVVDRTVRTDDAGSAARDRVLVRHPLQPFDPRNFSAGALAGDEPWSFDRVTLAGARALTLERPAAPRFLEHPLAPAGEPVVELGDLVRFVGHPVRAFLHNRLGVSVADFATEVEDALPVALGGLDRYRVGQRLLEALLQGADDRAACTAEIARGLLPPGVLGKPVIHELWPTVRAIHDAGADLLGDGEATSVEVRAVLPDGRLVSGTVGGVRGDLLSTLLFARLGPTHRLAAWVRLLALSAAHPQRAWSAVTIGRQRDGEDGITVASIPPLADRPQGRARQAQALLADVVDLYDRGLREPLPLPGRTAAGYAAAVHRGVDPATALERARGAWESRFLHDGEDSEREHVLAFDGARSWDELVGEPPRPDEHGGRWDHAQPSRFGRLAVVLWAALLQREELR